MSSEFRKGDIVLISFPFTDLSATKIRPAVIVSADPVRLDATFAFISSRRPTPISDTDMPLPPTHETGLKTESFVRFAKVATLDVGKVRRRLGRLSDELIASANQKLILAFGLSEK